MPGCQTFFLTWPPDSYVDSDDSCLFLCLAVGLFLPWPPDSYADSYDSCLFLCLVVGLFPSPVAAYAYAHCYAYVYAYVYAHAYADKPVQCLMPNVICSCLCL